MFVTYQSKMNSSYNTEHNGNTVSILNPTRLKDQWVVGAYTFSGYWEEWVAHVSELDGFDGE